MEANEDLIEKELDSYCKYFVISFVHLMCGLSSLFINAINEFCRNEIREEQYSNFVFLLYSSRFCLFYNMDSQQTHDFRSSHRTVYFSDCPKLTLPVVETSEVKEITKIPRCTIGTNSDRTSCTTLAFVTNAPEARIVMDYVNSRICTYLPTNIHRFESKTTYQKMKLESMAHQQS